MNFTQPIRTVPNEDTESASSTPKKSGLFRSVGLGLITGAADDDPSAIGTYASAGAKFGPSILWTSPLLFPMLFAVVYLSSRLGQISGQGLFAGIRDHYPRWVLYLTLVGVLIGNTFEAAADIGGMAAALNLLIAIPITWLVVLITLTTLALQIWGSYTFIRNVFRWLALVLLAYIGSAILAKPDLVETIKGTIIPTVQFNREFLSILVAMVGCTLSAYIYTWQSNEEVEEEIAKGRKGLRERQGASKEELKETRRDVLIGIIFSNVVLYTITLSTAATLFKAGQHDINTAADAAKALQPLAGEAAAALFVIGITAVGFLAIPIMTTGAAYDLCQTFRWKDGLHRKPSEAKLFYTAIVIFTLVAMCINFIGINPMKALVTAGIVQGFSTPPLLLLIMLMTNNRAVMGQQINGPYINILGWLTTAAIFLASIGLVVTSFM